MGKIGGSRGIGNDFVTFDVSAVVFINKEGFDDEKNPVNIRSHEVVELVE